MTDRSRRLLDELAALSGGRHRLAPTPEAAPDVGALLARVEAISRVKSPVLLATPNVHTKRCSMSVAIPVRLPSVLVEEAEALVVEMSANGRPEAIAAGQRFGRSSVLRLAVARGLRELRSEMLAEARTGREDDGAKVQKGPWDRWGRE